MVREMPMIVTESPSADTSLDTPRRRAPRERGELGKVGAWYEVWDRTQELEPDIEQLSIIVEDLEDRKTSLNRKRALLRKQREATEADLEEARQHKRFKLFRNNKKIKALTQELEAIKEQAATLAKQEKETTQDLFKEQGKLARLAHRNSVLYEVLRTMSLG